MKTKITALIWVFFTSLLVTSCKKEIATEVAPLVTASEKIIKDFKKFYQDNVAANASAKTTTVYGQGTPQWDKAISAGNENEFIIPLALNLIRVNEKFSVSKFLLLKKEGNEITGDYYHVISKKANGPTEIPTALIKIKAANRQSHEVIKTPLPIVVAKTNAGDHITGRMMSPGEMGYDIPPEAGRFMPADECAANGGTMVQIDWYYQEFDNYGNLIYEEYLYSTTECLEGGGGGGGGTANAPTDQQICEINMLLALNTTATSSTFLSWNQTQSNDLRRTRMYSWHYCKAGIGQITRKKNIHTLNAEIKKIKLLQSEKKLIDSCLNIYKSVK